MDARISASTPSSIPPINRASPISKASFKAAYAATATQAAGQSTPSVPPSLPPSPPGTIGAEFSESDDERKNAMSPQEQHLVRFFGEFETKCVTLNDVAEVFTLPAFDDNGNEGVRHVSSRLVRAIARPLFDGPDALLTRRTERGPVWLTPLGRRIARQLRLDASA